MYNYPIYAKSKNYGRIVEFIGLTEGTVITKGYATDDVGYKSDRWVEHTNSRTWEIVKDPRPSRTNRMLKAIK